MCGQNQCVTFLVQLHQYLFTSVERLEVYIEGRIYIALLSLKLIL